MANQLVNQLLNHPKRQMVVWATALMIGLLITLPCWDHYCSQQTRFESLQTELYETTLASMNVEAMENRLRQLDSVDDSNSPLFDQDRAERFRELITELTFDYGCQLKRLSLSDARQTPWIAGRDPNNADMDTDEAIESPFNLETRLINLSARGPLTKLTKLIIHLNSIEEFAVPTNLTVQREGNNGHLALDVEISLFGLVHQNDSRM
ncbi:hypothetical protein LOC67_13500 [Stieleria sp. JC731]|uniref:hypothetical protein n=1 Tax=Pirellulaceae TaxID=2691357 RepID=UPI001E37AA87|nr:hypothetical protein [Stieleria sp. JC731]MCC9601567.1 hypothetical protein [Stieleria sp. JC731]